MPVDQKVASSYRVPLSADGAFFPPDNGCGALHSHSKQLAERGKFSRVCLDNTHSQLISAAQHCSKPYFFEMRCSLKV